MRKLHLPTAGEAAVAPRRRRRDGQRGQSLVELSLSLPILLVLLLGLVEFGHAYNSYLTVLASARDAARLAAQGGASPATLRNQVTLETQRLPSLIDTANECTVPAGGVCITGIDNAGVGNGACTVAASPTTNCVRVKVCYDHPMLIGIPFYSTANTIHMCSKTIMRLADG